MTSDDLKIFRVASLTLANAMLFQELLSQRTRVKTLLHTANSLHIADEFVKQWKYIEKEIDFIPIFRVAREILLALPATPETERALRRLAQSAIKISRNRSALRHDLMGRIFHRLLADAKFYGAFYTKIPSATLLLKLAIDKNDLGVNWTDEESVGQIQIADFACGTGTLLKAAMAAIVDRNIEATILSGKTAHPGQVHRHLIENSLWGFDVLSSAVHLAAAAIAMHDPNVTVKNMHLYALPLGGKTPKQNLGSIDFALGNTLYVQKTLIGASIGPEDAITSKKKAISVPPLNICTMNPPFTRSVSGNLLFGNIDETERGDLQRHLREVLNKSELEANITSGLGSVFVAIADNMMGENGVFALVLPKAVLSGAAWEPTRSIFKKYELQYVICSHEPNNWNFSYSTELSETLLVLSKKSSDELAETVFVNLSNQPKTSIEALAVAREIQSKTPGDLTSNTGTCEIHTDGKKFGEMVHLSIEKFNSVSWALPVAFAQTDLCRIAFHLSQGDIFLPHLAKVGTIKTKKLSDIAELGPDGRDIYDGFSLTNSQTSYPAFWGYDADVLRRITQVSNQYLNPLTAPLPGRHLRGANLLWSRAGTLMLPKELWLTTSRVAAFVLPSPALSNVFWPTKWRSNILALCISMERRLALWFNSTLGLFSLLMQRQETRGAWVKFPKAWYNDLQVLDLGSLDSDQCLVLDNLWAQVQNCEFSPFPEMSKDQIRKSIDDAFSQVLAIPSLDELRNMLSQEPMITMQPP